jgi:peptidoglycan/xylan/chitin deacetylase (PgdA/CDA1 family)
VGYWLAADMRKIALGLGALLVLAAPVAADSTKPAKSSTPQQLALFQERSIFTSGLRGTHTIALTFDDGPNLHTGEVLDALREMNVRATFFIVGRQGRRYPEMLSRITREGHLLANHSANHARLSTRYATNPSLLIDEIREVHDQIAPRMAQGDKFYFRAPYGYWKSAHAKILNADPALNQYVGPIYWDVGGDISMSRDGYVMSAADWECWRIKWPAKTCAKGYLREIRRKNGGVVLMHSIQMNSAALVREVVPALIEEGYRFVRLDQVPQYRQYETPQDRPSAVADAQGRTPIRLSAVRTNDIKADQLK